MTIFIYSSKILHTWEFSLKGNYNKIEFWDSRISGKKKIAVNGEVIVENNNSCAIFNYSFQLDSYFFNLVQLNDTDYDLKINNNFFHDIVNYEISGDLKKAKLERESKKDNSEGSFFVGQSINTIKLENENDYKTFEENQKNINKIDFFPNDNNITNQLEMNKNPLNFTFKDKNNNLKETAKFKNIDEAEDDNFSFEDNNDYPSLSEL